MKKAENRGHYCKVCGEHKANEKFSGKGHASHICKSCSSLPVTKGNELFQKHELDKYIFNRNLSNADLDFLIKRSKNSKYPEVQEMANQISDSYNQNKATNTQAKTASNVNISDELNYDVVKCIINSNSIKEIEANTKAFLKFVGENKSQKVKLSRYFANEVKRFTDVHHLEHYYNSKNKNVIVLSEQQSPLYLLRTYIGGMKQVNLICDKLNTFINHCEEFVEPTDKAINNEEIDLVIDIANSKYKILDIIAPVNPLVVLQLNNSNKYWNSQCGVMTNNTSAILLIYHPKNEEGNDPVYIFTHELGHAIHLALTNDVKIMPSKFDDMNEALELEKDIPISDKAELFADVFAMAVLNCPELKSHDPFEMLSDLVPVFERYIAYLLCLKK